MAGQSKCPGILTEEWEHRLYAERDLDLLTAGNNPARPGV